MRTSVRSITLSIFEIDCAGMHESLARLPFSAFYANLACHLRDFWIEIEMHIELVTAVDKGKHLNAVVRLVDDIKETLYYMQDFLEVTSRTNTKVHA